MKLPLAIAVLCFGLLPLPQPGESNFLLVDQSEIDAAKARAERHEWARSALRRLLLEADRALARPLEIPERGGQWTHWYSCPKDGAKLATVSAHEHRCPVCRTIYSGEPFDSVVLSGIHSRNAHAVRDCALAYRFTGEARYADRAAAILTGYADRYGGYPLHDKDGRERIGGARIMAQTLDESVWLIPVAWGYAMVRDAIPDPGRRHIENDLLVAAAEVIRGHRLGIHNIQCWKNSAVGLVGYVTGRDDLVREAIDDPERGFVVQIAKGVTPDGLWYEGSMGYHYYTMQSLWPLAEAARHAGRDLYGERYRTLWDAPLALALPNGDPPGFNDSAGSNVLAVADLYEIAWSRWRRPAYGRLVAASPRQSLQSLIYGREETETGPMIPVESSLLREAGFAVLRAGGNAAAIRFGMHGGGHGHPDKLNLVTFGAGVALGLDPGSINYGVSLHREWYRSTIAHNTVSVDAKEQAPKDGALEDWTTGTEGTSITVAANDAYPGVALRRTVTMRNDGSIEDRFACSSEESHMYDWAFHVPGALTSSLDLAPRGGTLGDTNGYQHITRLATATADGPFWVRWRVGGATLTLEVRGVPATEVITGEAPGRNPAEKVPLLLLRRRGAATVFEVVHRAVADP